MRISRAVLMVECGKMLLPFTGFRESFGSRNSGEIEAESGEAMRVVRCFERKCEIWLQAMSDYCPV